MPSKKKTTKRTSTKKKTTKRTSTKKKTTKRTSTKKKTTKRTATKKKTTKRTATKKIVKKSPSITSYSKSSNRPTSYYTPPPRTYYPTPPPTYYPTPPRTFYPTPPPTFYPTPPVPLPTPLSSIHKFNPYYNDITSQLPCGKMPGYEQFTCVNLPLRDIKYIIGPCSFHYFKYAGRNIYLFGEVHDEISRSSELMAKTDMKPSNSIMFAGFVHSLVKQNPTRTYDLMYESPIFFEKGQNARERTVLTSSPTSDSIYSMFYDCINPDKRQTHCQYQNLRTHYIDYRYTSEGKKIMNSENLAQQISDINKLISTGKLSKQIAAINDPTVRTSIENYAQTQLKEISLDSQRRAIKYTVSGPEYDQRRTEIATEYSLDQNSDIMMDIYGISRMLREFDQTTDKNNSQFKGTSDNIIYYAGASHIKNMVKFFRFLKVATGFSDSGIKVVEPAINVSLEDGSACQSFMKLDVGNRALNFVA